MIHGRLIFRLLSRSSKQAIVFILCVLLSLLTLTALNGLSANIDRALSVDARKLHAGDIIIRSSEEISGELSAAIDNAVKQNQVSATRYFRFYSVVRRMDDQGSVLADLKVVDTGYPFYGEVVLASGRPFEQVLTSGKTVAEASLLARLGLGVGDRLKVGHTSLEIADTVVAEPDRPVNIFSLGPRLFITMADNQAVGLMQTGSRVRHVHLLKVHDADDLEALLSRFKSSAQEQERVETYKTASSRVKRFLDNFLFYMQLAGVFILVLAGVGIFGTLTAFIKEKTHTVAIMRTLGAGHGFVIFHFFTVAAVMTVIGAVLGIGGGYLLQRVLLRMLADFLPPDISVLMPWRAVLQGLLMGLVVVTVFSFVPLYRLREMRPVMILRRETATARRLWPNLIAGSAMAALLVAMVVWHTGDIWFAFYLLGAIALLMAISALASAVALRFLQNLSVGPLIVRQAVKGLFRPGNATSLVTVTLATSLCLLFSMFLLEKNLKANFVQSFPADTPNLIFLDIQPAQRKAFSSLVDRQVEFYPVIRARVMAINGKGIDREAERRKRSDNFARMFNLTYRDHLLGDERLIRGAGLFRNDWGQVQVSILDTVAEMHPMTIGDTIEFNIQGVPLIARISSIRTREESSFSPFFYFVFEEKTLGSAPQTLFAALKVDQSRAGELQNKVVKQLPNVSVIDLSEAIRVFAGLLQRLSQVIRMFSTLSIFAGILILVGGVMATRAQRTAETVYYKILGGTQWFVLRVFSTETILTGMLSSILALAMAQTAVFLICGFVFDISYQFFGWHSLVMVIISVGMVATIGMGAALPILKRRPAGYLRRHAEEA